jgi:DNA-binding MarR family transcriptional regulator
MGRNHHKSMAVRLSTASRVYRSRIGNHLSTIDLHAGQEGVLKALDRRDGQSMTELAAVLGVQPPTVTKMVVRLAAKGYVERRGSEADGRLAHVHLTRAGRDAVKQINRMLKRVERQALTGIGNKDQKRLGKMLRRIARNLGADASDSPA